MWYGTKPIARRYLRKVLKQHSDRKFCFEYYLLKNRPRNLALPARINTKILAALAPLAPSQTDPPACVMGRGETT